MIGVALIVGGAGLGAAEFFRTPYLVVGTLIVVALVCVAFLLHLRDQTGQLPHIYFGWSEGNPLTYLLKYIVFGEGDTAPVTHEVLRQAEEDPERRPVVHVGG